MPLKQLSAKHLSLGSMYFVSTNVLIAGHSVQCQFSQKFGHVKSVFAANSFIYFITIKYFII